MQNRARTIVDAGYPFLVALTGHKVCGYAYVSSYRPRPAYRWTVENSVYVHPDDARQGIGRLLLENLILRCTTLGFRQMIAIVGNSNNHASIKFHEQAGFQRAGIVRDIGHKFDRWMDQVILQKPLGNGANTPPDDLEL